MTKTGRDWTKYKVAIRCLVLLLIVTQLALGQERGRYLLGLGGMNSAIQALIDLPGRDDADMIRLNKADLIDRVRIDQMMALPDSRFHHYRLVESSRGDVAIDIQLSVWRYEPAQANLNLHTMEDGRCLVLDIRLGAMSGLELVQRLAGAAGGTPT